MSESVLRRRPGICKILSHTYGSISYNWSSDCSSCTASTTCSRCKYTYSEKGHIEENSYEPGDCQNKDKWDYIATFDTLGDNECPDWHYGMYGNHDYESFSGKDPTCTETGYTSYEECRICGRTQGYSTISASGHTWIAPTCTGDGYCDRCGEWNGSATGHNMTDPTCTENGYCLTCGATGKPAKGHDWVDTGLDVITETSIYSVYECANCGATKEEYEGEQEPEESSTTTTTTTTTTATDPDTGGSTSNPTVCKHQWETITSSDGTNYQTCSLCGITRIL